MQPVTVITGTMAPLYRADVDTDQIMPKQFLKRVERTGFGQFVFHDWREDPDFVLNDQRYASATVLVTGPNFGSGSSREHAPWGLQQHGFEAIIAPSFADIFKTNCAKNGLLTVELDDDHIRELVALAHADPAAQIRIDLPEQTVESAAGVARFDIDAHTKHMLVAGLDPIGLTLQHQTRIGEFEARRLAHRPTTA
ncbi:MAG: 3-isopropylmalate dehydratase small subunit [Actinobacteria bacterium QS_5_72_10]|nr:MAG: 3-isopropylmalate dehydratase small subunit [Actinobacteria bacterium QS_8_72_14]PSO52305.1 MAG: 3-isopropylmalate dehydratase small subunit [Actinobacteria bacterium QS_5_72_10]